ncbi:PREDICTED: uncharacterized protein LOC108368067 [Rhagoletis zephyria]|uniref:uncharacterized protein LOC108368067 n=1 Tax=Rhagoletis zephyria TaxID=28612 RepID=UPI000811AA59|nr:PREDICTED: uncharacterized protein LOC108368067 [Rhagoletis zephyria]
MASEKCELYRTGGSSAAVRSNSVITKKVATILGESATGMENAFDGDEIDISTPEKSKVHHEEPNNSDDLNQENLEIIDVEGEEWSSWTPNSLRTRKSSKLLVDRPVTRKRTLEEEKTKLAVFQQKFYEEENVRAQEKHEQELIALQLKNELLQLEIIEKKAKLDSNNNVT